MLPDTLIKEYVQTFYGFGNWNAKIWFIGIEEAGGADEADVQRRLLAWAEHGRRDLENAPEFYPACGNRCWHGEGAKLQPTWRQLIRILFLARGVADDDAAMLEYQRHQLGVAKGETCIAELLPLPSPGTAEWSYQHWSDLAWLRSRKDYVARARAGRENQLRSKIKLHQPKAVIFYGLELPGGISLLPSWSSIAGGRFDQAFEDEEILLWRQTGDTALFVTRHPAAESDNYFRKIGIFLREHHGDHF